MRIIDRKAFLAMPEETVFAKYATTGNFSDLCIKGTTYLSAEGEPIDFLYQPLADGTAADAEDSGKWADLMLAAEKGEPFKLDLDCQSRDGFFDLDQLFVIWEPNDVKQLVERLRECLPSEPDAKLPTTAGFYWVRGGPNFRDPNVPDELVVYYDPEIERPRVSVTGNEMSFSVEDFEWLEGPLRRKP